MLLNTAVVKGIISIVEIDKKRFEIEVDDLDIMVHYNDVEILKSLKEGMIVEVMGKCFTGGVIANHVRIEDV